MFQENWDIENIVLKCTIWNTIMLLMHLLYYVNLVLFSLSEQQLGVSLHHYIQPLQLDRQLLPLNFCFNDL